MLHGTRWEGWEAEEGQRCESPMGILEGATVRKSQCNTTAWEVKHDHTVIRDKGAKEEVVIGR